MTFQFVKGIDQYGINFKPKREIGCHEIDGTIGNCANQLMDH
jgi:hypothetical protein